MTAIEQGALRGTAEANRPYSPSWLNRLLEWIKAMPGPSWPYYLGAFILLSLLSIGSFWLRGEAPVGVVGIAPFLYTIYPIYFVALMHYLDGEAKAALAKFRPALQVSDSEYAGIEYELTTVPARGAWIATVLALLPALVNSLSDEVNVFSGATHLVGMSYVVIFTWFTMACAFILIYHTVRQLRMVSRLHAVAPTINLFQAQPAYAFSQLTARTGIGLMLFAYFDFVQEPPSSSDPLTYILIGVIVLIAVVAFVLPLLGMHQRLVEEKNRLESDINGDVEIVHQELRELVKSRNYAGVDELDKVLSSLLRLREVVAKLSTWPWQAETLRGFVSALLVPIFIWAVTQLLERFI